MMILFASNKIVSSEKYLKQKKKYKEEGEWIKNHSGLFLKI